jgi:hypothetical protein
MPQISSYPYSLITRILNTKIHSRLTNLNVGTDTNVERDLVNSAVRVALSDIDFRGNIRETILTPNLMDNQWDYALPTDVKADNIIDFRPQVTDSRDEFETYSLTTPEEFDRRKKVERGIYTILNDDLTRVLRISADITDNTLQISSLNDTAAGGGDWTTFDSTSINDSDVKADVDDFVEGTGSIRFQTDTTDSTDSVIGIQNATLTQTDISSYLARGSAFVDAKLTNADTGLHQITLRIGSDSNNYYQVSDSNQNDCSAFMTGWNKVRWDFQNKTTTGTPADTANDYAAIFWSRDTTTVALLHLNDTDWAFDNLQLKRGKYYLLSYYTRNVWQDTAFGVNENSTNDSHALMVQNDELEVIMAKIAELASQYLRDPEDAKYFNTEYQRLKIAYLMKNPSQSNVLTTARYNFINSNDSILNRDS